MILVDTGAWFAAFVPNDRDCPAANEWLNANHEPLVTSDYVVDELLTLLKVRGEYARAESLGGALLREDIVEMHWVTPEDVLAAWDVYQRFRVAVVGRSEERGNQRVDAIEAAPRNPSVDRASLDISVTV